MKILLIHTYYRDKGGEDAVIGTEMSLLKSAGWEVSLLAFQNPKSRIGAIIALFFSPFNPFSFIKIGKKIHEFKPDVVHIHNWHFAASPSIVTACHRLKVPVVMCLHNFRLICPSAILFHDDKIFLESLNQKFPWKAVRLGVYRGSIAQTFLLAFTIYLHKHLKTWKRVNKYLVFSEFMKTTFLKSTFGVPAHQFMVKANSIQDLSFDVEQKRQSHFLFIGRLVEEKGIEVVLAAFANTPYQLVIYGYGPLEQKVKTFAEKHPNIQFKGALAAALVPDEMRKCSALIFPSTWFEGMPITLLEAFSTGTPVIASNLGAMSTMVEDQVNGLHFEAGNSSDLAQKIAYWYDLSDDSKTQYSLKSREVYEKKYTPEVNLKMLESLYLSTKSIE